MSPAEQANRAAKARRFIDFLDDIVGRDLVTLANLSTVNWSRVAEYMGESPPSADTLAVIEGLVKGRDVVRARKADPFAGLPS